MPPEIGARVTRVRVWMPVPQERVQEVQVPQASTSQSTGHLWALQSRVWVAEGQVTPPFFGATILRVRVWEPVPQESEHTVQDCQPPTLQFTGQAWALHLRSSLRCLQALPPKEGANERERLRVCMPVPQVAEQVVQASQSESSQSRGQLAREQGRFSAEGMGQALPPLVGAVQARLRSWVPVPQDTEQVDQAPQPEA